MWRIAERGIGVKAVPIHGFTGKCSMLCLLREGSVTAYFHKEYGNNLTCRNKISHIGIGKQPVKGKVCRDNDHGKDNRFVIKGFMCLASEFTMQKRRS